MPGINGTKEQTQHIPYNLQAEEAVLASILIEPEAYYDIADLLTANDFYRATNGRVFKAMADLLREGVALDTLTLVETLRGRKVDLGEPAESYLAGLMARVPSSIHIEEHARIVHAAAVRRRLIRVAESIAATAWDESKSIESVLSTSEASLFSVTEEISSVGVQSIKYGMTYLLDLVEMRRQQDIEMVGLPTGFEDLDRLLGGLKRGDLYVLAGRPGMGKSLMETAIRCNVGKAGQRIAAFNLEMSREQILMRMAAAESGVAFRNIETGRMTTSEYNRFCEAVGRLSEMKMWIDDTPSLTPTQLEARCRRLYAEHGLDLVTVDYLQLMGGDRAANNRTQEVGQISRALKSLAKTLNIPVLALAQLSRAVENRRDKQPTLSDLRESGDIENDADVVMLLYRDEYYYPNDPERPNILEVEVAKHRNGPPGTIDLYFSGRGMTVRDLRLTQIQEEVVF